MLASVVLENGTGNDAHLCLVRRQPSRQPPLLQPCIVFQQRALPGLHLCGFQDWGGVEGQGLGSSEAGAPGHTAAVERMPREVVAVGRRIAQAMLPGKLHRAKAVVSNIVACSGHEREGDTQSEPFTQSTFLFCKAVAASALTNPCRIWMLAMFPPQVLL